MRGFPLAAAATVVAGTILTFSACSGVPDINFTDVPDTSSSSSGNSGGSSGSTSSSGTPTDGPKDVVSDCKATGPEICDDGIDNDCNGKTDCEDDACKPVTQCVDPAPPGWTLVAFSADTRPMCATGYDTPTDLEVVNGTGLGNCTCACNPTAGTACSAGAFAVTVDANSCNGGAVNITHNTNCTQLNNNVDVPAGQAAGNATPPVGPSTCGATTTPAAGVVTLGKTCGLAAATKLGKGCGTGAQQCAPKATGFGVCITKVGTDTCPSPYTQLKTAGSDAVDTRGCNTCTCEPKGCSGSIELFQANDCTVGANKNTTGTLDPSCDTPTNKNFTATHYKSTLAQPTNGCGIQTGGFNSAMTGDIAWTDKRTVCCKP